MFPHELTFGVFDAAVFKNVVDNAILWIKEVSVKPDGKVFFAVIDGGTRLESNDDARHRYFLRAARPTGGEQPPRAGDIYKLTSYRVQQTSAGEPALVVSKMEFIRHASEPVPKASEQYPYQIAPAELQKLEEKSRTARYRQLDPNQKQHQQQHYLPETSAQYSTHSLHTTRATPDDALRGRSPVANPRNFSRDIPQTVLHGNFTHSNQSSVDKPTDQRCLSATSLYPTLSNQPLLGRNNNPYVIQPPCGASNPYGKTFDINSEIYQSSCLTDHSDGNIYGPVRKGQSNGGVQSDPGSASNHPSRAAPYPPQYRSSGAVAHRTDGHFVPIRTLTAFLGRWIVKGRFINVGEPRPYTNQRGEGRIWNMDLVDGKDERGTIRCTFFNKAIDKFHTIIKENEIYTVSKGTIKTANKKFNSGAHDFELHLGEDAEIRWIAVDDPSIPIKHVPQIVPISQLASLDKNTAVSVCGILIKCSDISEITARSTGRPREKRDICIVDDSGTCVDVTLWGQRVHFLDQQSTNPSATLVLLIENARVDEYNGRRLSSVGQTSIIVNPQTSEGTHLRHWFEREGRLKNGNFNSLTTAGWSDNKGEAARLTIAQIKHRATSIIPENELEDKGAWFSCRATLLHINSDKQYYWVACSTCGKKVTYPDGISDSFGLNHEQQAAQCINCEKEVEQPVRKYILSVEIADSTGALNCIAMGDRGVLLMGGITADELVELSKKDLQPTQFKRSTDYFADRQGRLFIFKIHAKMERYRDAATVKYRIFSVEPISGGEIDESNEVDRKTQQSLTSLSPGMIRMRQQIRKDAKESLDWIYEHIPRTTIRC